MKCNVDEVSSLQSREQGLVQRIPYVFVHKLEGSHGFGKSISNC